MRWSISAVCGLHLLAWSAAGARAGAAEPAPPAAMAVLNNDSYLRAFLVFKTPVFVTADGQVKVALDPTSKEPKPLADFQSPLPPQDWVKPEFDDSAWDRTRAPVEVKPEGATGHSHAARHSATCSSLTCLRGKFVVQDPEKVPDLRLSLEYVGGVVVSVNGQEVARAHLPAGPLAPDTLAEKYPDDLYCEPDGVFLQDPKKNPAGFERRYRRLADAAVPSKLLRKGTNLLAVEVHRSAINEAAMAAKRTAVGGMYVVPGIWAYAGVRSLALSAAPGSAVTPNTARPKGVQVWNCLPFETIQATDYGDPGEAMRPVAIPAARNGLFSGRIVVSADEAIRGLQVAATDLEQGRGGAKIPASAVRVRCAAPAVAGKSWAPACRFDALVEGVPAEMPVVKAPLPREEYLSERFERKSLAAGAVAPLWVTVRVPKDARPGAYEGEVRIAADGLAATAVPLRLTVHDWVLPDPKDFRMRNLAYLEAEGLAQHYGAPLWSDRHFELMGKSLALMAEVNSRQVILNLTTSFYGIGGNAESVIRWVRKADGSFAYDFAVFDKYLDLVARVLGKPLPLRLNCWGEKRNETLAKCGKAVSLLDPATGKLADLEQPAPGTPESGAFWKPVLAEVRKRVEARGWWDVTSFGHTSYCYPPGPEIVGAYRQIWPDGVWSYTAHNGRLAEAFGTKEKGVSMPVPYAECVWTEGRLAARGYAALLKPRKGIWCSLARTRHRDSSPLTVLRHLPEEMIMRGHDGVGQLGADVFPVRNPQGRFTHPAVGRGGVGPDCSTLAILAPGPDGALPTERFEMFREGVQLCEAILFLQRALEEKAIGGELAERVNRCLDGRAEAFLRQWSAGRFERDAQLLALAGEVAAQMRGAKEGAQ